MGPPVLANVSEVPRIERRHQQRVFGKRAPDLSGTLSQSPWDTLREPLTKQRLEVVCNAMVL